VNYKPFILDCSVAMTWCFEDEFDKHSQFTLNYCSNFSAVVPPIWHLEVTNALLVAEKRSRVNTANAIKFIDLLNSLPIYTRELSFSIGEIINVARTNKLASEDTTYLILAMHEGLPMATNDKALIKACLNNGVFLLKDNTNQHFS